MMKSTNCYKICPLVRIGPCCHLCTCSRFGLSLSPNHRLSCVIIYQSPNRKFYHTYRYYLRSHFGQVEILSGIYYIYSLFRADCNDASSGFGPAGTIIYLLTLFTVSDFYIPSTRRFVNFSRFEHNVEKFLVKWRSVNMCLKSSEFSMSYSIKMHQLISGAISQLLCLALPTQT